MATSLGRLASQGCVCIQSRLAAVRLMSSNHGNRRNDGPPPWAPLRVPTGHGFTPVKMAKMQNKGLWRKREEYVNKPWKQILTEYTKRQQQTADEPLPEPPKLLMVRQVKKLNRQPNKYRQILKEAGINEMWKPYVVKNTRSKQSQLQNVSHLIEIFPVTFPYGVPETAEDIEHAYLCDNGAFVVRKRIAGLDRLVEGEVNVTTEIPENKFEIKQELIDRLVERKKQVYQINQEFFPTQYIYKKNQDKKEYRYTGDQDIGHDQKWH